MQHVGISHRVHAGLVARTMGNRVSRLLEKPRPDTPSSSFDGSMALDLHESGLNTPPPSSTTSFYGQSKHSASPRIRPKEKHGKRKERDADHQSIPSINTTGLPRSRNFLPPSPELTSTSGLSIVHDARLRYDSHTPDPTPRSATKRVFEEHSDIEVVIDLDGEKSDREAVSGSRRVKVTQGQKPKGFNTTAVAGSGKSTSKLADSKKHKRKAKEHEEEALRVKSKSKSKSKRKDEGRDAGTVRASKFGIMAGPKVVTTYESRPGFDPSSLQHGERAHKRPRLDDDSLDSEEDDDRLHRPNQLKPAGSSRITSTTYSSTKKKIIISRPFDRPIAPAPIIAPPINIPKLKVKKPSASLSRNTSASSATSSVIVPSNRQPAANSKLLKSTLTHTKIKLKTTSSNKSGDDTSDASKRLRAKDPIKYYAKKPPTGKSALTIPSGPKSKGKAVRKKIAGAGGEPVVRSRQPSPFPAWHRTTAVLNRFGVPLVETREVDRMPDDNCYILIPIYEAKTKLVQPELIPDRFDGRSSHPALQVNELLRRGMPMACRWGDCDAILACETMLDKHINKCGHVRKALVIPREHYEPDAWICQWDGCDGKAFAEERELNQHVKAVHVATTLHCPYVACQERSEGYEKMSLLAAHVRKSHHSDGQAVGILRPLIGANDNRVPPKRHADPLPESSEKHKSVYVPVARAVWRYEQRKRAVIDLVSDQSFIDRLDVKMQAGNLEMNINIGSDPEQHESTEDEETDSVVPEVEEVWLDREPESEVGSEETASGGELAGVVNRDASGRGGTSRMAPANPDAQKRRSTRRTDAGQKSMEPPVKAVGNPRDMGYCVLIPVTREWVALPSGPESM